MKHKADFKQFGRFDFELEDISLEDMVFVTIEKLEAYLKT